ncbi:MAG TPA: FAD-binding monooxygenase, partial [Burkholderiaceae bacterium]|nr:FAD-binding monooxygenase [Burkholderiaceae bacterium]
KDTPRQDILPALDGGCLSERASAARGTLFPQPWLHSGCDAAQRMDTQAGHGWRLVCGDALAHAAPATHGITRLHIGTRGVQETQGVVAAWMRRHQCHAALVRPDHYVFGVASTPAELDDLLDECSAWLHGSPHPRTETSDR